MKYKIVLLLTVLFTLVGCGITESEPTPTPEPTPLHMQGLDTVLDYVREVEVGTAGAGKQSVWAAVNLLSWLDHVQPTESELKKLGAQYIGDGTSEEFELQMQLVYNTCRILSTEAGQALMDAADVRSAGYMWSGSTAAQVGVLMNGMDMLPAIVERRDPGKAPRPETVTETILIEGMEETVTYTLVKGDGWSFYMTDEDWKTDGWNVWTARYNEKVRVWVAEYPGYGAEEVKQYLMAQGYDDTLFKNDGSCLQAVAFHGYAFLYETPASTEYAEGWGVRLADMANTFELDS